MAYIRFAPDGTEISCPEGMRVNDGPRMAIRQEDWPMGVHFYEVTDLETNKCYNLPSVEASLKCGVSLKEFRRWYNRLKKNRTGDFIFNGRYQIKRIPKYLFIKRTKRRYRETTEYYYRY
jgi:hypothetical protein